MFGTNEIVGKSFFKTHAEDTLAVTSMFFTLQGEGPFAGLPALFIRLAKCNLACSFCFPSHYPMTVRGKGSNRLDEVKKGDQVITLDDNLNPVYTKVTATNSRWVPVEEMVTVNYIEDGKKRKLVVTRDHPFNVKDTGFVSAVNLRKGDILVHLPGAKQTSFRMASDNPLFDKKLSKKMGAAAKTRFASGEQEPYVRDAEWRENQSARMSDKNPMHDNDVVKKVTESKTYDKSSLEKAVHRLLNKAGYAVKYVGNKKGWLIGDKENGYMRPDFIFKETKKLVEVYDKTYPFYTDDRGTPAGEAAYKKSRRAHYKKFGYEVMFLTAQDLGLRGFYKVETKPIEHLQKLVNKFITNGAVVTSVKELETKRVNAQFTKAGTYKDGHVKVTNLTCDGNHTYCMKGIHTHNCDTYFDQGLVMPFDEILRSADVLISKYWHDQNKNLPPWVVSNYGGSRESRSYKNVVLVITGGEPLLQNNLSRFLALAETKYETIQIESNGIPDTTVPEFVTLVCSPKCAEKDGIATKYLAPSKTVLNRANYLKFVMSADQDSPYSSIPEWAFEWADKFRERNARGGHIYVSPMNVYNQIPHKAKLLRAVKNGDEITMEERSTVDEVISFWEPGLLNLEANQLNHEYAARYCLEHGLRFNMQMHLFASLA